MRVGEPLDEVAEDEEAVGTLRLPRPFLGRRFHRGETREALASELERVAGVVLLKLPLEEIEVGRAGRQGIGGDGGRQ